MNPHGSALYDGPIFDSDTHIHEHDYDFFREYLPKEYHADWLPPARSGRTAASACTWVTAWWRTPSPTRRAWCRRRAS
jgi:hypothetical protein